MSFYLDDSSFAGNFEDLALPDGAVTEADVDDFCELGELNIVEDDKGSIDLDDGPVVDAGSDGVIAGDCLQVGVEGLTFLHDNKSELIDANILATISHPSIHPKK
jgi:hypothetical protein